MYAIQEDSGGIIIYKGSDQVRNKKVKKEMYITLLSQVGQQEIDKKIYQANEDRAKGAHIQKCKIVGVSDVKLTVLPGSKAL